MTIWCMSAFITSSLAVGGHSESTAFPILETLCTRHEYSLNRTLVQVTHIPETSGL